MQKIKHCPKYGSENFIKKGLDTENKDNSVMKCKTEGKEACFHFSSEAIIRSFPKKK